MEVMVDMLDRVGTMFLTLVGMLREDFLVKNNNKGLSQQKFAYAYLTLATQGISI